MGSAYARGAGSWFARALVVGLPERKDDEATGGTLTAESWRRRLTTSHPLGGLRSGGKLSPLGNVLANPHSEALPSSPVTVSGGYP
jgi:hypothetical protein